MMKLVNDLEKQGWNTPILPNKEIYTGPQPMPQGKLAGHRSAALHKN